MRYIYYLLVILPITLNSQQHGVGINSTKIPAGVIFDVSHKASNPGGVLFPVISLTSKASKAPFKTTPADGIIIYNSTKTNLADPNLNVLPGYYYWDTSVAQWIPFENINKTNHVFESSNQDTTTNFNAQDNWMDLFSNIETNQNTDLYVKRDNYNLYITETGFYRVVLNFDMKVGQAGQDRDVIAVSLYLNGIQQTDRVVIKTKETHGGTQSIGGEAALYIYIPKEGATLSVKSYELNSGSASRIYFNSAKTSTINIERIR